MSVYPFGLDSDQTINRIDDNISELAVEVINQIRDAIFKMQAEFGIGLSGSMSDLASRLAVAIGPNGQINNSALASAGLVTLPITDNHVGVNAGIKEYKLSLDHSTSDLYTAISANATLLSSLVGFYNTLSADFNNHLGGAVFLSNGSTSARHVASHIDLNSIPTDVRDSNFTWTGLRNKQGNLRAAAHVASALLEINEEFVNHQNATADAHVASAISVDVSKFQEIPLTANSVQKVVDYLDDSEVLNIGQHRATQHSAGIPSVARSNSLFLPDGYGDNVVPPTSVTTYLLHPPATGPVDNNTVGDDLVKFNPTTNTNFVFDALFSQVRVGDIVRINYANGMEASFPVESIRFVPGVEWYIRIAGVNLCESDGYALARIDRPSYDRDTSGVLALAPANATPTASFATLLPSLIVGHPQGASALGLGFDPNQLDSNHYKLYLELYPTGNPADRVISMPFIDVTGNAGATPGKYTLSSIIHATNDNFRKVGYNYRFIAYEHKGDFGIMLADPIGKASFAIISGANSSGTLAEGSFTQNVIGDATDGFDALGLGQSHGGVAGPSYQATWVDATAAQNPTKIHTPRKRRFYIVNGQRRDNFAATYLANSDGYWPATIIARNNTGSSIETTYQIDLDLSPAELRPGKTLVVQPAVDFDSLSYLDYDYGRFIIKDIVIDAPCGSSAATTTITVINGIHAAGNAIFASSGPGLNVHIYFGEDSVGFNDVAVIDQADTGVNFHRFHEIFVSEPGKTFSHERARMPIQNETVNLLRTDFWHIESVSPKLRGYRDTAGSQNKYIRFYVLRYDSTSGEFDGYIGQRDPSGNSILNFGPVTTGRKSVTTRFYDETYNDYIDLSFQEINAGPTGVAILADTNKRYVDIEIFPTLQLNDELMLIGSCEVNWAPTSPQAVIQNVKNLRAFGSVDETDFTQSALDFIRAGDRALHENGIVRGFDFVSINSLDNREILFKGGLALVNGKLVTSNNMSVTIPQISEGGTPATVTWAICVNESGYLEPIIITSSKDQFFAQAALYYVPSVTFAELVNNRKDLTPIALVDAAIASITINPSNVYDVRRFVGNQGLSNQLVLSSDGYVGHFRSFPSLKRWVNQFGQGYKVVTIRGNFDITSQVDLSGFNNPIVLQGDGAVFNVTSGKGFVVGNGVTFRNLTFNYNPTGLTYTSGDKINSGNGCIFGSPNTSLRDISIELCSFNCSLATSQRPPFINFELNKGDLIQNVLVTDCRFNDGTTTTNQAAVAVVNLNDGASSEPATAVNVVVKNNICNGRQGIYLTSPTTSTIIFLISYAQHLRPGLNLLGCKVLHNYCGAIGFIPSSNRHSSLSSLVDGYVPENSLLVSGNQALFIGWLNSTGNSPTTGTSSFDVDYGTGKVIVSENSAKWIHAASANINSSTEFSSLTISNNSLSGYDENFLLSAYDATVNAAILVNGVASEKSAVVITGNTISPLGSYHHDDGIVVYPSATISNNFIGGLSTDGRGIALIPSASGGKNYIVTSNKIYRNSNSISYYIGCSGSTLVSASSAIITDNFFDNTTVDGYSTTVVGNQVATWVVDRNKNQTVTVRVLGSQGFSSMASAVAGGYFQGGNETLTGTATVIAPWDGLETTGTTSDENQIWWTADATARSAIWDIPLFGIVPVGANITNVAVRLEINATFSAASQTFLRLDNTLNAVTADSFNLNTATLVKDFSLSPTLGDAPMVVNPTTGRWPKVRISSQSFTDSSGNFAKFGFVSITYVY